MTQKNKISLAANTYLVGATCIFFPASTEVVFSSASLQITLRR